ncbi:1-(5-phosphoribosyl)-5-[(5-phosphoribosylamino)methylideneamino]imidazole-4-carboxamide isomerase [Roseiterribacter gracilis]|uniref:1-(5-phosphoribosyl)-5-[(5-phosphoribosylamino)methylideneamino] imidazole-4-carboxamide isomerase n=1 Tax=Roseiterribacter gracilis TaxID=2812848 RepID=A0A8S8X9N6_9PROT|nr:1-(5-phosphoribosyl)-5-[(5-phosphoribosylamino) methylideneamino] imidazole-4-carboxamide isomerase [Rhodospirillales bacterium TMPK1]
MILFPAIDLKDGKVVRLLRGDLDQATVFNDEPVEQALKFERQGFTWLHVVDLNGAVQGRSVNGGTIEAIAWSAELKIQLGGGVRTVADVHYWLDRGVERVVLGTVAVTEPDVVVEACKQFPDRVAVGIDARGGFVATDGWTVTTDIRALDHAKRVQDAGAAAIIYTDIDRDGALTGVNIAETVALAKGLSIPVIASGGVGSMQDLLAVRAAEKDGIAGVICGRALYDGSVDPVEAIALFPS